MSENNSVNFFKQLVAERTDLLIAEQSQVVKSIQNAINKLDKAQRRLRGDLEMMLRNGVTTVTIDYYLD